MFMQRQLILIEGIPGVGKTTTAQNIKKFLDKKGIKSKLFLEGNFDHPADYENVAYLTEKRV
jgi:thymidylate kinase